MTLNKAQDNYLLSRSWDSVELWGYEYEHPMFGRFGFDYLTAPEKFKRLINKAYFALASPEYARVLPDPFWWLICDDPDLGFVPISRFDDDCWRQRFNGDFAYPAPRKTFYNPKSGNNVGVISLPWLLFVEAINTPEAFLAILVNWAGWINVASNPDWPAGVQIPWPLPPNSPKIRVEGITSIENKHRVAEVRTGSVRFVAFDYAENPPDPNIVNPATQPWMFQHFNSIDEFGNIGSAPEGHDLWLPLMGVGGQVWLPGKVVQRGVSAPSFPEYSLPDKSEDDDMDTSTNPLWRTYDEKQGTIDFIGAKDNGVVGMIALAGESHDVPDKKFSENWVFAKQAGMWRASSHILHTDINVEDQLNAWLSWAPEIDVIPRMIRLEVDKGDDFASKGRSAALMAQLVYEHDGVRPIIFSNRGIINSWLAGLPSEFFINHFFVLAQYDNNPAVEDARDLIMPNRVHPDNAIMHQTTGAKPGFDGEAENLPMAWNRWQGTMAEQETFITREWEIVPIPIPPVEITNADLDDIKEYVEDTLQIAKVDIHKYIESKKI